MKKYRLRADGRTTGRSYETGMSRLCDTEPVQNFGLDGPNGLKDEIPTNFLNYTRALEILLLKFPNAVDSKLSW